MYASQWIGLFLHHVLRANDDSAVGADDFITQLCDENDIILEKMITTQLIEEFVKETDKGREAPRLLSLLRALCASQNKPIIQNQLDVVTILVENEEAKQKLLMPIKRIKKRYPIQVCLDLQQEKWVDLVKVCEKHLRIVKRHEDAKLLDPNAQLSEADFEFEINYQCFNKTLDLFAETCLHRNKEN